ncbi:MAG: DUF1080 domain-containing protein [Fuerstiella sp.]|nr:DUF1080 domain-containing protein [Fuerstiella sp.]
MKLQPLSHWKTNLTTCLAITITVVAGIGIKAAEPADLFDGKTLRGWQRQQGVAEFRVENGMIIGKTVKDAGNTLLCTTKHYTDFDLTFEVRFLSKPVNSGCVIRSLIRKEDGEKRYMKKGNVYGPQVEIEGNGPKGSESGNGFPETESRASQSNQRHRVESHPNPRSRTTNSNLDQRRSHRGRHQSRGLRGSFTRNGWLAGARRKELHRATGDRLAEHPHRRTHRRDNAREC